MDLFFTLYHTGFEGEKNTHWIGSMDTCYVQNKSLQCVEGKK